MAGYQAHKIHTKLYQGGAPPPGEALKNAGIDVLVLCSPSYQDASLYSGITVILAPGDDDARPHRMQRFLPIWEEAARQVVEHVKAGRRCLVTCWAGQNRSGLVNALVMRELTGWTGEEIVKHIQDHRPLALNNETFVKHIVDSFPKRTL